MHTFNVYILSDGLSPYLMPGRKLAWMHILQQISPPPPDLFLNFLVACPAMFIIFIKNVSAHFFGSYQLMWMYLTMLQPVITWYHSSRHAKKEVQESSKFPLLMVR